MRSVEGLLGAAVSLETSSENPSMRADGTTFRLRCTSGSVEPEDLDGREELTGVPHIDEVDVGDIADSATRGYENHLCHLSGSF